MTHQWLAALLLASPIPGIAQETWTPPDSATMARARALLRTVPLIDTHNDLPYSLFERFGGDLSKVDLRRSEPKLAADLPRLRADLDDSAEIARRQADWERRHPHPRGTVADVADHIDHIRKVAGIDHIGIGSDFFQDDFTAMAIGLEDASTYPNLFGELLRRGYTDLEIQKIAGLNLLRAMRAMEQVAARLQRPPRT